MQDMCYVNTYFSITVNWIGNKTRLYDLSSEKCQHFMKLPPLSIKSFSRDDWHAICFSMKRQFYGT